MTFNFYFYYQRQLMLNLVSDFHALPIGQKYFIQINRKIVGTPNYVIFKIPLKSEIQTLIKKCLPIFGSIVWL